MIIDFGREICGNLNSAEAREWLVTNGIGGYASGTVAGLWTRAYHGLLVAALKPPLDRKLLLAKIDEFVKYDNREYQLGANRWQGGLVEPQGYWHIESFHLEGTIPVWTFACGDALLEKRVWMQPGANTTYVYYHLRRATQALKLSLKALVNYRPWTDRTRAGDWRMNVESVQQGVCVTAYPGAVPFYLLTDSVQASPHNEWYRNYELAAERERGDGSLDDNLYAALFDATLEVGKSLTLVASTQANPDLNGAAALDFRRTYEQQLINTWQATRPTATPEAPDWVEHLILAADQFIVNRPLPNDPNGKTVIAGYHWFTDWGRDTMISLPGLTLATGRPEIAGSILRTFSQYVDQGMLPNVFPGDGSRPTEEQYNTIDATLWYFEAIRAYHAATGDDELLGKLFPVLVDIIEWHSKGTRYNIKLDPSDGLIYGGQEGWQLTWMDAKYNGKVFTPRIGKPIEINALWYNALRTMSKFAQRLGKPHEEYDAIAQATLKGFNRFWNQTKGYCFDVLDSPNGSDDSLRPNQLFAVSLPESPLTPEQQRSVVEVCGRVLITSHGLRSLTPDDKQQYKGHYGGAQQYRDAAYHQGTVWGWLIGPFVLAHLRVFNNPVKAREFLEPMKYHLRAAGLGTISEIFDGDAPMEPKGCIAQAWSVAEVLRAWIATEKKN
ncbi:MAG TPA: amylo-alpha-1,6-glucosidase [Coleofasciculaceae cyanobacterium]